MASPAALAAEGGLDPRFGVGGTIRSDFNGGDDRIADMAVQPDGRLVVVGETSVGGPGGTAFAAARYQSHGALDPSFGRQGKAILDFGPGEDRAHAVALQTDGKIVVAGEMRNVGDADFAIARYLPSGILDADFSGGRVVTRISAGDDRILDLAIQPDGRIVVAGTSSGDFGLVRYNANGTLDPSFDRDGQLTTPVGTAEDAGHAVALEPNGRILVAGSARSGIVPAAHDDFALVRYESDGRLDVSFAEDGRLTTSFSTGDDRIHDVALESTEARPRITVAGSSAGDFALARYLSDGTLDATFDDDGKQTTAIGGGFDTASAISLQPDGRIVVAGFATNETVDFALARYTVTGSLDTSFDTDGKVTTRLGEGHDGAAALAFQHGRIVVAGESQNGPNVDFAVARYFAAPPPTVSGFTPRSGRIGTEVTITGTNFVAPVSVAINGTVTTEIWLVSSTEIRATVPPCTPTGAEPSGTIAVTAAGGSAISASSFSAFWLPGELDSCFRGDGKETTRVGPAGDTAHGLALQPDGRIIVVGESNDGERTRVALARYDANGDPDYTFGGDGTVTAAIGPWHDRAYDVLLQPDGKLVVAGSTNYRDLYGSFDVFAIARYNADGSPDAAFHGDGAFTENIQGWQDGAAQAVAIQSDGKIVAAGYARTQNHSVWFTVVRLNRDGSVDTTFGEGGWVLTPIGDQSIAYDIAVQPDGKIVVGGESYEYDNATLSGSNDFAVARYNADGSLDTGFGGDGALRIPIGRHDDVPYAVTLQPDSRIVVAGESNSGTGLDVALVRLNANGSLDTSFDGDGKVTTALGGRGSAKDVAVQPDGKIVVAGSTIAGTTEDIALARFMPDGRLDQTFDGDGKLTTPVGSGADTGEALALQPDGRIIVAGSSHNGSDMDFALARYRGGPVVSSFTPTSGVAGVTQVTISGSGFEAASAVTFGGKLASFRLVSATQLVATVPRGATSGTISVTTPAATASSARGLDVALTVTGFTPSCGPTGSVVDVSGLGFTGAASVQFNGTRATYAVRSAAAIRATVPTGATTGPIAVATAAGTTRSAAAFVVTPLAAPTISGFTPSSGVTGRSVTITGTNLCGASSVTFNGKPATFVVNADNRSIVATVPNGATTGRIRVATPGGAAASASDFGVTLSITALSPVCGPIDMPVSLTGLGFTSTTAVTFNGTRTAYVVASSSSIRTTVPSGATSGPITVTTASGTARSAGAFVVTALAAPTISGFTPASAVTGRAVTISGANLCGASQVTFNGKPAVFRVVGPTSLVATVPNGATTGRIRVATPGGAAASPSDFRVTLSITGFTPARGPSGTEVTINGVGFTNGATVRFNGVAASSASFVSATQLRVKVPANATTGRITVSTAAGTATSATSFTRT